MSLFKSRMTLSNTCPNLKCRTQAFSQELQYCTSVKGKGVTIILRKKLEETTHTIFQ